MKLYEILPEGLRQFLRDRYIAGVSDAEALFEMNEAEEDSLVGALGQAISTSKPFTYEDESGIYRVSVTSRKIRGRGPHAPEKLYGADGIFQIEVTKGEGRDVFVKGLPFQAKKRGVSGSRSVSQAKDMLHTVGGGVVIDFSRTGYTGCRAEDWVEAAGKKRKLRKDRRLKALGQILGNDFLKCDVGIVGLVYREGDEAFHIDKHETFEVIDTEIKVLQNGG